MNNNSRRIVSRRTFWCLCLAAGLLFLGAVFLLSRHADMQDCERRMTELIDFVKGQSSSYVQYNETAVAKELVRGTTAVQELDGVTLDCGEDELRQYVERLGLTGISVLDANGRLVCEYSTDSIGYTRLQTDLEAERVLAVIGHPQSTYDEFWLERLAYQRAPYSQSASETVVRPRHGSLQNAAAHRRI